MVSLARTQPHTSASAIRACKTKKHSYVHTLSRILALSFPLSITNLLRYLIGLITISFVGRLGEFELSCAILGLSLYNVSGTCAVLGLFYSRHLVHGMACHPACSRTMPSWHQFMFSMRCTNSRHGTDTH
jgi:hypothetical protein